MKTAKILLTVLGASATLALQAFAGSSDITFVPNGHGQSTPMYRSSDVNLALYQSGNSVGTNGGVTTVQGANSQGSDSIARLINHDNGHGQQIPLFY